MSIYVFLNWLFCVLTFLLLIGVIWRYRYLVIKPSIIVIGMFHIQIQWAAAVDAAYIELYLPQPYDFFILAQLFPLIGLIVSFFFLHKRTAAVYSRIAENTYDSLQIKKRTVLILMAVILFILAIYLVTVPLASTGIYAILLDPLESTMAREESLKLLDNAFLKYGFALLKSALAPVLSVLVALWSIQAFKRKKYLSALVGIGIIFFTLVVVLLPGARMPGVVVILSILMAIFLIRKLPIRPLYILISSLLILSLPVFMTMSREGKEINASIYMEYMKGGILHRVFVVPMETGLWHAHYGQDAGFVGVTGIPKLAELMGQESITLPNVIYMKYSPYSVPSGLSNTCFVFAYYACFGMMAWIVCLIGLWALDLSILVFQRLRSNALLIAAIAAIATSSMAFISNMYTTVLITDGFVIILLLAVILDKMERFQLVSPFHREKREAAQYN